MFALFILFIQTISAFYISALLFDILHLSLHQLMKSNHAWLKTIGDIHRAHHRFFSSTLTINKDWEDKNLKQHVIVEYVVQLVGISSSLLFFPITPVLLASILSTYIFLIAWFNRGADLHHRPIKKLLAYPSRLLVDANYHALHHVYPNHFYSSYLKIIDYLFGSCLPLSGKHIAMTGASGALGSNMKKLLETEGAIVTTFKYGQDYNYDDYEKLRPPLIDTDILFLCHGTKYQDTDEANCFSFVKIIELYKAVHKKTITPPEIWAVGSEIECHPCFGIKKLYPYANSKRRFASYARRYFHDRSIQYRHLVHSAFTSQMGPGLMSAGFSARMSLFLLKRGFKYIPVSYTGFAFLNYFRYIF